MKTNIESMWDGYIEALLWSETDDQGQSLDALYDVSDIDQESLRKLRLDCAMFFACHFEDCKTVGDWARVGHDFCLTRNHHGAGFWDRGLGDLGERLTVAAHSFGEQSLYVGDDNQLHAA